jgi:hypothetical protein
LIAPLMMFLITIVWLIQTLNIRKDVQVMYKSGTYAACISILLFWCIGFIDMGKTSTIISMMVILFLPVAAWFITWVKRESRNTQNSES